MDVQQASISGGKIKGNFFGGKRGSVAMVVNKFIAFHLDSWVAEWLDAIWKCYFFSQGRATHLWIFLKAQHDLWARL